MYLNATCRGLLGSVLTAQEKGFQRAQRELGRIDAELQSFKEERKTLYKKPESDGRTQSIQEKEREIARLEQRRSAYYLSPADASPQADLFLAVCSFWDLRGWELKAPYYLLRRILDDQRTSRDARNLSPELKNIRKAKQFLAQLIQDRVSQLGESQIGKLEKLGNLYFDLKPYDQLKEVVAHGRFFSSKPQKVVKAIRKQIADVSSVYVLKFPALCETLRKIDDIYGQEPVVAAAFPVAIQRSYYTSEDLGVEMAMFPKKCSFSEGQ
jgi:hypothetical protein